jgi:hypothetical protein
MEVIILENGHMVFHMEEVFLEHQRAKSMKETSYPENEYF